MFAGAALGAAVIHGLHAQDKPKAYQRDRAARYRNRSRVRVPCSARAKSCRWSLVPHRWWKDSRDRGSGGPKSVAISEWNSLEQAQAFYNSPAWNALTPYRNKAIKTIRRYVVEARD